MRTRIRSWWKKIKRPLSVIGILAASLLVFALIVVEVRLYGTGFAGKTLFEWLNLLGVLAIPVVVGLGTVAITTQQRKAQEKAEQKQQYKDALQTFINTITKLILEKDLLDAPEGSPARTMAQAQTTMTLSINHDSHGHKAALLQFMHGANLIKNPDPVISLSPTFNRERSHNVLNYLTAQWEGINLYGADLHDACLRQIDLRNADLRKVDLSEADLSGVDLSGADLSEAILSGAKVTDEQLAKAKSLKDATMPDGSIHP